MDIHIQHLCKQFDGLVALNHLTLHAQSGQIVGIVGPDGAGKTTLMRILAGLIEPSSGEVKIDNLDIRSNINKLRQNIGYMPQRFGLYQELTVGENLALYADLHQLPKNNQQQRIQDLLDFSELTPFIHRQAGSLSGGMKQKLGLACVLIMLPKILLLDEPSVGVDPIARRALWQMIKTLATNGITIIWSTAYLDEAERFDQVFMLYEGKLLTQGSPLTLQKNLSNRCFLLSGQQDKRLVLQHILATGKVIDATIQGNAIRVVLREEENIEPFCESLTLTASPISANLEDVFMDQLGGIQMTHTVLAPYLQERLSQYNFSATQEMITASSLSKHFGDFIAVDHISFSLKKGEVFGLLGPNGAGKSTTFKLLCGLLKATQGQALLIGTDIRQHPKSAKQTLGYMAQKFSLYEQLTVKQNLNFFAGIYGLKGQFKTQLIQQMLAIFHLEPFQQQLTEHLSLGFKQRLALACATMHAPPILFLDEPTSGVDPLTRREFWLHINGLAAIGMTILVTTHFMEEAEYCDRIGLVYRGKLIACETPDHLKTWVAAHSESHNPTMEEVFIHLIDQA